MQEESSLVSQAEGIQRLPGDESAESSGMLRVEHIPLIIFTDLSENLGVEDEFHISVDGFDYRVKRLNPDHEATGFPGAIGYELNRHSEHTVFTLWPRVPKGSDSVFEPKPLIQLIAGRQRTGVWAHGKGEHYEHMVWTDFGLNHLSMDHPGATLVGLIIIRAARLARDPNVEKESYWWNDRHRK